MKSEVKGTATSKRLGNTALEEWRVSVVCTRMYHLIDLVKDGNERLTALHFMISVTQYLYRALGLHEVEAPRISRQSTF
jgi:hypothetical protein